jgi:uncharacterized membrane protein YbhN (UPF0104 family)
MKFELNLKDKYAPLSPKANRSEILCWIIASQGRELSWWKVFAVSMTTAFIVYIVTGKLILGTFVP